MDGRDEIVASYESVRFLPLATSSAFRIQQARRSLRLGDSTSSRTRPRQRTCSPRAPRGLPARDELPLQQSLANLNVHASAFHTPPKPPPCLTRPSSGEGLGFLLGGCTRCDGAWRPCCLPAVTG